MGGDRRGPYLGDPGEAGGLGRLPRRARPLPAGALRPGQRPGLPRLSDVRPQEQGRFRVHFEPFAERLLLPRAEREAALRHWVQAYADRLQHHCLHAPLDWFNFFDFWQLTHDEQ